MEKRELQQMMDDLDMMYGYPKHVTNDRFAGFLLGYYHAVGHYRAELIPEAMRSLTRNPKITRFPVPGEVYQAFRDAAESAPAAMDTSVDTNNVAAMGDMLNELRKSLS